MYTYWIPFIRGVFSFSLYTLSAQPVLNCITSPLPLSFLLAATHVRRNNITTSGKHNDVIAGSSHICPIPLSPVFLEARDIVFTVRAYLPLTSEDSLRKELEAVLH